MALMIFLLAFKFHSMLIFYLIDDDFVIPVRSEASNLFANRGICLGRSIQASNHIDQVPETKNDSATFVPLG